MSKKNWLAVIASGLLEKIILRDATQDEDAWVELLLNWGYDVLDVRYNPIGNITTFYVAKKQ